jgi:hypothetical protein
LVTPEGPSEAAEERENADEAAELGLGSSVVDEEDGFSGNDLALGVLR